MDKNYYDILQININASPEIIEKAYKTLAKKYHPDLQPEEGKQEAEQILKEINEAYEVLSNPEKKQEYDIKLKKQKELEEQQIRQNYQNQKFKQTQEELYKKQIFQEQQAQEQYKQQIAKQQFQNQRQEQLIQEQLQQKQLKKQLEYKQQLQYAREKAYHDAYIQDLKNRGYKIKYKKTFKDYIRGFISIIAVIFILFLLWQIPFIKNYFINFYKENEIIHFLVDTIINLL